MVKTADCPSIKLSGLSVKIFVALLFQTKGQKRKHEEEKRREKSGQESTAGGEETAEGTRGREGRSEACEEVEARAVQVVARSLRHGTRRWRLRQRSVVNVNFLTENYVFYSIPLRYELLGPCKFRLLIDGLRVEVCLSWLFIGLPLSYREVVVLPQTPSVFSRGWGSSGLEG